MENIIYYCATCLKPIEAGGNEPVIIEDNYAYCCTECYEAGIKHEVVELEKEGI